MGVLSLVFAFANVAHAQSTHEQVTTEYFAAIQEHGFSAIAAYLHPDELERFKQMLMPLMMSLLGGKLEDISFGDIQILGSVRENEIVHVVARVSAEATGGVRVKSMEVISAKPLGEDWKLMLTGELEGLAAALAHQ